MLLFFFSFSIPLSAQVIDRGVPILNELQKLERLYNAGKIEPGQKKRLSEIYLLTSRCADLKGLLKEDVKTNPEALCVCGLQGCDYGTVTGGLFQLKRLLAEGGDFDSVEIQGIWKKLQLNAYSEAKYVALKEVRGRLIRGEALTPGIQKFMRQWESDLEALEVK